MRAAAGLPGPATPRVAGVASGVAYHVGLPVAAIRWCFVLLTLAVGVGGFLYAWLWITLPRMDKPRPVRRLAKTLEHPGSETIAWESRRHLLLAGAGMVVAAIVLLALFLGDTVVSAYIGPFIMVLLGLALIWSQVPRLSTGNKAAVNGAIIGGLIAVGAGLVWMLLSRAPTRALISGMAMGLITILGSAAALAPLWIRQNRDMARSQAQKARESERADIAAHLHDSVLQTLTLIRMNAEDSAQVRALALRQERELRSWLYTGHAEPATSLAQALREAVGQVESTFAIPIEVVAVGDMVPGPSELAMVAAASEAVTNACKHGAPPISVYLETKGGASDIFVKDNGTGFDLATIPTDRHGVRSSMIARMKRVGGSAQIRTLESGTDIHLHLPGSEQGRPTTVKSAATKENS